MFLPNCLPYSGHLRHLLGVHVRDWCHVILLGRGHRCCRRNVLCQGPCMCLPPCGSRWRSDLPDGIQALAKSWLDRGAAADSWLPRGRVAFKRIDDRQITHLICDCLKHLLYDLFRGVLGLLYKKTTGRRPKTPPKKSYTKCAQIR